MDSTFTYTTNPTINWVGFVSEGPAVGSVSAFQLTATAVPEPTAALLGTLGMLALLRRRRA
jgi:MYXO-CTERM domain-containing protein